MRRIAAALSLMLMASCAEVWTRPGTTEPEAEAANAACRDEASLAVPVQLVWTMVESGGYDRERRCYRRGDGREICNFVSYYRPPRFAWVDVNEAPRDGWRRQCMRAKGFEFQGLRPLRLQ
jgi:hypothetical protein